jgi:MFS family permease
VHRLHRGAVRLKLARDQLTRATYATFAFWGWFLYGFGPAVPLLRDEQGTTRAVAGLHGTAIALGTIISAAVSVPLVRRFQRRGTLIGATVVAASGITLLVAGPSVPFTLAGALVAGIGGSICLNAVNPVLSDHHGRLGAAAISEANAIAAGCGIVAPLAVGVSVSIGLTWRGAVVLALPLAAVSVVLLLRAPRLPALVAGPVVGSTAVAMEPSAPEPSAPEPSAVDPADVESAEQLARPSDRNGSARRPLGLPFWLALGLLISAVAAEFCTTFWAPDLLHARDGMTTGASSAAVSAFLVGMTVGRLAGVPLTMRMSGSRLLFGALTVSLFGWAMFWLTTTATVAVAGLAVFGLGLSFVYPLALVRLMVTSDGRPDTANAVCALGVGLASGIAPFALGALADHLGSHRGFLLVPVILVVAMVLLLASVFSVRRRRRSAAVGPAASAG